MNKIVKINEEKCIGCGRCVRMCPAGILYMTSNKKAAVSDENRCDRLRGCMFACPTKAIEIV